MKKLLSLLSVLTISGTAVPTVIAASHYQKEENNDINYLQTNNLEILNRSKRYYFPYTNIEQKYIGIAPKISGWYTSVSSSYIVPVYTDDYLNWAASSDSIINLAKEKNDSLKNKNIITESYDNVSEVHTMNQDYKFESTRLDIWNNNENFWGSKTVNVYFRLGNPIIKFLGWNNEYRGEIGLDIQSHKNIMKR